MSLAVWELQLALADALAASPALTAVLGDPPRLWDEPPPSPLFPYVTIGATSSRPIAAAAAPAVQHDLTLHVWSRYSGRKEAREIASAIAAAVDEGLPTMTGARLVTWRVLYADVFRLADGRTTHGLMRLRAVTEPLDLEMSP